MIDATPKKPLSQIALSIFTQPDLVTKLTQIEWQGLLRIWRGNDILGNVYYLLERHSLLNHVPEFALRHFTSAKVYSDRQSHQVCLESEELRRILGEGNINPIFLKGATYVLRNDLNHYGRVMSDMDILVEKHELNLVEEILQQNGWIEKTLDDYDEQYYRKWIHELPPYTHTERGTTLDIHHTLIPPVTGYVFPESLLFDNNQMTENGALVLKNSLVVIHCVIHFLFNEDYERSCRDVIDLHYLIEDFIAKNEFNELYELASELGFVKELYNVFWLTDQVFDTQNVQNFESQYKHSGFSKWFAKVIMLPAIAPNHDLTNRKWNTFARFIMFLRGHYLKMPMRILLPHFVVKSYRALVMMVMGPYHYEK